MPKFVAKALRAEGYTVVRIGNKLSIEVTEQYALRLRDRILAEPITAIITLPIAFVGPILLEISWLSYPPVVKLVRGRRRATKVE